MGWFHARCDHDVVRHRCGDWCNYQYVFVFNCVGGHLYLGHHKRARHYKCINHYLFRYEHHRDQRSGLWHWCNKRCRQPC